MSRVTFNADALSPQAIATAVNSAVTEFSVVADEDAVHVVDGARRLRITVEEGITPEAIAARFAGALARDFRFRGKLGVSLEDEGRTLCIDEYRRKSPAHAPVRTTRR
jgi:hypothetical protein